MEKGCAVFSAFLLLLCYLTCFGLMIAIVNFRYSDSRKFEYVWICSQIKTIKNIVKVNSFKNQIFNSISPSGKVNGLSVTYYELLKLNTEFGCKTGYKQCGILDTFGNKLCIDNYYQCPINSIIADLTSKQNYYIDGGYNTAVLKKMSYNYYLYFSSDIFYGNATISLLKSYYKPRYINNYNFILDLDAFQETFESLKFTQKNDVNDSETIGENIQSSYNSLRNLDNDQSVDLAISIVSSLERGIGSLISYSNTKSLLRFFEYLDDKLEQDEKYIDKYYIDIGDNYYVKNYIGFRNNEDLDKFLNFDFSLHKRLFPNKIASIFAIICLVLYAIFSGMSIASMVTSADRDKECPMIMNNITFWANLPILLGFLIYSSVIYRNVYKSKDLLVLNEIKSDDFINGFIKDYIALFDKTKLILATIVISAIELFLQIIGMIIFFFAVN